LALSVKEKKKRKTPPKPLAKKGKKKCRTNNLREGGRKAIVTNPSSSYPQSEGKKAPRSSRRERKRPYFEPGGGKES